MRALAELCNLLTERRFATSPEVIAVLLSQCPAPGFTQRVPVQLTGRQYNGLLFLARYAAFMRDRDGASELLSIVLEFLQGVPAIVTDDSPFTAGDIDSYFEELLKYVAEVASVRPDVATATSKIVAGFIQRVVADPMQAGSILAKDYPSLARPLFFALSKGCPTLTEDDAEHVAQSILKHLIIHSESASSPSSPQEFASNGESSAFYRTPESNGTLKASARDSSNDDSFEVNTTEFNSFRTPESTPSKFSPGAMDFHVEVVSVSGRSGGIGTGHSDKTNGVINGYSEKSNGMTADLRKLQASFEAETLDALERQDLAIRLFAQVLEQTRDSEPLVLQLRAVSIRQLRDVALLLKVLHHHTSS